MNRYLSALLFLLLVAGTNAQKQDKPAKTPKAPAPKAEFFKGYIVTDKGDTVRGQVKYNPKKEQDCYSKVIFKDEAGTQKNYKPKKAIAYGFNDQHYVAMEFDNEMKYYQVVASGELMLYKMMYEMIRMNEVVIGAVYYIGKQGEKDVKELKESKFKKQMADYMKDNPEILEAYEEGKDFNAESAIAVIKQYNAWKAAN